MHPFIQAVMQCYAKAAAYIETNVLTGVDDRQTRKGLEFLVQHAKTEVENIQQAATLGEVPPSE